MTTVILVGLIVVLLAAAAYIGVLLLRRMRSAPGTPEPGGDDPPRTVADLVRRRAEAADDLSGPELFVPAVPRQDGVAVPDVPEVAEAAPPARTPQPATPVGGIEAGDAPWRRAARMMGAEPGGAWETAPLPVVAETRAEAHVEGQARAGAAPEETPEVRTDEIKAPGAEEGRAGGVVMSASPSVVIVSRAAPTPTAASLWTELEAMQDAARSETAERGHEHVDPAAAPLPTPSVCTEPAGHTASAPDTTGPAAAPPADGDSDTTAGNQPAAPGAVSRPLSDPDLTPLMGIPVIRPVSAEAEPAAAEPPAASDTVPADTVPADTVPADTSTDELPGPSPRVTDTLVPDDDVVVLLPSTPTGTFSAVAPSVASGSPQPVWFRVVRRDGEPVPAAVVALLDDHGREVDTTKTAVDGGGELHSPHAGRFLMIVSADGYQPRAAILTVDDGPVELALLLPRSAAVGGTVRSGGEPVRDVRVAIRQDHDAVDEALTGGDGRYRFDDLAEGTYTVAASDAAGSAMVRLSLAEGAALDVDLDLAGPARAR